LSLSILQIFSIANINTLDERYFYLTTCQLQMLITNISSLIFLKDFILVLNYNIRKKEQAFNKENKILTIIVEKSIKKNKKHNNMNSKLVDQLISKKEIRNIVNQD